MASSKKRLAGRLNAQKARHVQAKNKNLETAKVIFVTAWLFLVELEFLKNAKEVQSVGNCL